MNQKKILISASFLSGVVITALPWKFKLILLAGVGVLLFMKYDEWEYSKRVGGAE